MVWYLFISVIGTRRQIKTTVLKGFIVDIVEEESEPLKVKIHSEMSKVWNQWNLNSVKNKEARLI